MSARKAMTCLSVWLACAVAAAAGEDGPVRAPDEAPRPAAVEGDQAVFVFLDEKRPVFLHLHLQVEGASYRGVWQDFSSRLFGYLDVDNDGSLTNGELAAARQLIVGADSLNLATLDAAPRNGRVEPAEFTAGLEQFGEVQFTTADAQASEGAPLWKQLDADGDGAVTREELAAARERLHRLDLDDDELLTDVELQPYSNVYARAVFARRRQTEPEPTGPSLVPLPSGAGATQFARDLLARYDGSSGTEKDRKLSPEEIALDDLFSDLDADGDKLLDMEELGRLVREPPAHVSLLVRLGSESLQHGKFALIPHAGRTAVLAGAVRLNADGTATINLGSIHVQLSAADPPSLATTQELYRERFESVDVDGNGYLDETEGRNGAFGAQFARMDRNGDKLLYFEEVEAYLRQTADVAQSRVALTATNQGRKLFDVVDANRDGQLSPRELVDSQGKLPLWDADGDGRLGETEIPHQFAVRIQRAQQNPQARQQLAATIVAGRRVERTAPAPVDAPQWFQKMDRNGDGDITRREFLGDAATFTQMDADGDGMIDPREAGQVR